MFINREVLSTQKNKNNKILRAFCYHIMEDMPLKLMYNVYTFEFKIFIDKKKIYPTM